MVDPLHALGAGDVPDVPSGGAAGHETGSSAARGAALDLARGGRPERRREVGPRKLARREALAAFGATCAALGLMRPPAAHARRLFPDDLTDRYLAYRQGRPVGERSIRLFRTAGDYVVDSSTRLVLGEQGGVEVSFRQRSREVWRRARLHALESLTESDGETRRVYAEREEAGLLVRSDYFPQRLHISGYFVTSTLWHRDSRLVRGLLDVGDGRLKVVRPRWMGRLAYAFGGRDVMLEYYQIRGEIERDAWYSPQCELIRSATPLHDGSWVTFERQV